MMKYCGMCKQDLPHSEFKIKTTGVHQKGCLSCLSAYGDKYKKGKTLFDNSKYHEDDGESFVKFHEDRVKDVRRDYYGGCSSDGVHDSGGK